MNALRALARFVIALFIRETKPMPQVLPERPPTAWCPYCDAAIYTAPREFITCPRCIRQWPRIEA